MFKKKPDIKNLSPLRSSDRRKLADQIILDYRIPVPEQQQQQQRQQQQSGDEASAPQPTVSSLRNSLLPESTSSARFTTTAGPNLSLVSGTIYVGAHPGQDERILWFQTGKNPRMIPTVYTLWQNPAIVPLLHTPDFVVEQKLTHGSDLMIPGLVKVMGSSWDARATAGAVVAVAGMKKDTVPMFIGTTEVDVSKLGDNLQGQKGVAVKGLHWAGDEAWSWRPLGSGGREAPESVDGWAGLTGDATNAMAAVTLDDDNDADGGVETHDGGVSLSQGTKDGAVNRDDLAEEVEEREPTTKEVDEAFQQAFLFAVHKAKTDNKGPHYGLDFPIQPSFLISGMIQPHLKFQNQHYNIKKTSWKNPKKFIKHLDKAGLLKSKDRNGGETVILDIDFDDMQVTSFRPYPLPKPKATAEGSSTKDPNSEAAGSSTDPSVGQKITIQTVYRASAKLVPTLLPSKTEFYSAQQISSALKSFVEQHPDLGGQGASSIKLDPFIANNILGSNPAHDDSRTLASGRILRSALQKRLLEDTHLCQPYHVITRGSAGSDQKPKAGPPPHVHITIEKRTGTKVVTKISNLEPFFIDPQLLTPELQKKCAGSASAGQLAGGRPGLLEVVVQGDQRKIVGDVLAKRGIDSKWIDVTDKTKGKKK
ncbi:Uu.00g141340.m01.CDS01 [Anthostomella pinea]|uniref:Uu.00g141340.m01.CDS01 n=1 Tax=Anthostomella pinea TaxID=933095 RepID=A0AAI8YLC3_9PEZI|nr:Uu.00g141340.m01.CDS01 [Anthostomella pinea]